MGAVVWTVALALLLAAFVATGIACVRGSSDSRIVALMFTGEIATLLLLALAAVARRDYYIDCALAASILPYPSSIVFAHFFERWL